MEQHLVNDLFRCGVMLVARANATESQGPSEGIKGLKVEEVTTLCVFLSFLNTWQHSRDQLMGGRRR